MWCSVGDADGEIVPAFLGVWLEITQVWSFAVFAAAVVTPESHAKDDSKAKSNNNGRYGVQGASTADHNSACQSSRNRLFVTTEGMMMDSRKSHGLLPA